MVFSIILLLMLGMSMLFNIGSCVSKVSSGGTRFTRTVGPKFEEVTIEDKDSQNKIAVIEINGIISSSMRGATGRSGRVFRVSHLRCSPGSTLWPTTRCPVRQFQKRPLEALSAIKETPRFAGEANRGG